jgi:hypothetical protein
MESHWFEQVPGSPRQYPLVFPGDDVTTNVTEPVTQPVDPASPTFASEGAPPSPGVELSPPALPSGGFAAVPSSGLFPVLLHPTEPARTMAPSHRKIIMLQR